MSLQTDLLYLHRAKIIYVVVCRDKRDRYGLLMDPGMNRPWSNRNRAVAEDVAKRHGENHPHLETSAMSIEEAIALPAIKAQLEIEITMTKGPN